MLNQFVIVGTLLSVGPQKRDGSSVICVEVHIKNYEIEQLNFYICKNITEHIKKMNCVNNIIGLKGMIKKDVLVAQKISVL